MSTRRGALRQRHGDGREAESETGTVCGISLVAARFASLRKPRPRKRGMMKQSASARRRGGRDEGDMSEDGEDAKAAAARRSLALLNAQADAVRAELAGLRRDLAKAKDELSGLRSAQLLEANAELVQAAVHADSVAQTAVSTPRRARPLDPARRADRRADARAHARPPRDGDRDGAAARDPRRRHLPRPRLLQADQRFARPRRRRPGAAAGDAPPRGVGARIGLGEPARRRRVRGPARRDGEGERRRGGGAEDPRVAGRAGARRRAHALALGQPRHQRLSGGRRRCRTR